MPIYQLWKIFKLRTKSTPKTVPIKEAKISLFSIICILTASASTTTRKQKMKTSALLVFLIIATLMVTYAAGNL
jgi:hypothetical protein